MYTAVIHLDLKLTCVVLKSLCSSFVRQANGWGFRRFTTGPNCNSYYHEYFLRGMPWLCKKMRRLKVGEKKHVMAGEFLSLSIETC